MNSEHVMRGVLTDSPFLLCKACDEECGVSACHCCDKAELERHRATIKRVSDLCELISVMEKASVMNPHGYEWAELSVMKRTAQWFQEALDGEEL